MYQHTRLTTNRLSFFQKFKNYDYLLLFVFLLLGFISFLQCIQLMVVKYYFIQKVIFKISNFFSNDDNFVIYKH